MKKVAYLVLTIIFVLAVLILPAKVYGWFGAGQTPGWPPTTTGLTGEIALPQYKFAPDFYVIGDTVNINVQAVNLNSSDVTSHYYLAISKVNEAPIGSDINDGTPTTPGLNENQLYDYHNANNDVQTLVTVIDLGDKTFPANGNLTFGGSYTTNQAGYYQFDFIDIDPSQGYQPGHILAAGFFRVLTGDGSTNPSPTPTGTPLPTINPCLQDRIQTENDDCGNTGGSPTPTATPTDMPTASPTATSDPDVCANIDGIQTNVPNDLHLDASGRNCVAFQLGGAPQPNNNPGRSVLGTSTITGSGTGGQVLGASTTRLAGTSSDLFILRAILAILGFVIVTECFLIGSIYKRILKLKVETSKEDIYQD